MTDRELAPDSYVTEEKPDAREEAPAEYTTPGDMPSGLPTDESANRGRPAVIAADMAKSAPGAIALGVGDVAGLPGTTADLGEKGVNWFNRNVIGYGGELIHAFPEGSTDRFFARQAAQKEKEQSPNEKAGYVHMTHGIPLPTSAGVEHAIRTYAPGLVSDPETQGGQATQQALRFGTGAVVGGLGRIGAAAAEAPTLARSILAGIGQGGKQFAKGATIGGVSQAGTEAAQNYGMDPSYSPALNIALALGTHRGLGYLGGKTPPGAPPPTNADIGSRLREHASESKQAVDDLYSRASSHPGQYNGIQFDPQNPATGSPTSIMWTRANEHMLNEPGFPHGTFDVSRDLAPVREAQQVLNEHLSGLNGRPHTVNDLETTRRDLSAIANHPDTSSTASHHIGNLMRGFDAGREEAATTPGFFTGDGAQVSRDINAARAAHSQHMDTYGASAPPPVRNAVNRLGTGDDLHIDDPHLNESAGSMLGAALKHTSNGPMTYGHLQGTPFAPHVDEYLRGQLLSGTPEEVTRNLAHPNAARVFTPTELKSARSLNKGTLAGKVVHGVVAPATGTLAASLAATHDAGLFGTAAADVVGKGAANIVGNMLSPKGSLYDRLRAPPKPIDWGQAANVGALMNRDEHREEHARGGKVGHQHLVDRLFSHVEKAKRAEKSRTSVLLSHPDEHIAKALNVAQEAI